MVSDMDATCIVPRGLPQGSSLKKKSVSEGSFIRGKSVKEQLRLPRPTPAHALMWVLHWLRCLAEEPEYVTANPPEDYGQIRGGCSCPWMIAVD